MTTRKDRVLEALERAAAEGSLSAAFILGRIHDEGWGVAVDEVEAFRWYKAAAEGGLAESFYFVASGYDRGAGTRKDARKAFSWFQRAADAGDLDGAYMAAQAIVDGTGVARDEKRGLKLMTAAAERGSRDAMVFLAAHFLKAGRPRQAEPWAVRAAEAGDDVAPVWLAEIRKQLRG